MKRIAVVISYPLRRELAVGNRILSFLIGAHQRGYDVLLISPGEEPVQVSEMPDRFQHKVIGPSPSGDVGFIRRAIREASVARRLLKELQMCPCEKIVISIPSMFLLFLSSMKKEKLSYLDVRDLTWEYLSENSWVQSLAKRIFRRIAKSRIGQFTAVTVTNMAEFRYMKEEFHLAESQVHTIPNGISARQFEAMSTMDNKGHRNGDNVVVSYIGNIGIPQNLMILAKVANEIPNVTFNIIGTGGEFERIRAYKQEHNIDNVRLLGRVPWEEVPKIYSTTDILYAQLSPDFSGALPSKLYEYLSTGKFFIYGGEGQAPEFLADFDNHVVVPPDDVDSLKRALVEAVNSQSYRMSSDANVSRIKAGYLREANAAKWLDFIDAEGGMG